MGYDFNKTLGEDLGFAIKNLADGVIADGSQIQGSYFVVDDFANINTFAIVRGSQCYVTSTKTLYVFDPTLEEGKTDADITKAMKLASNNWKPLTLGASFEYADHILTIKVPIVS